jgi:hypothetical protein
LHKFINKVVISSTRDPFVTQPNIQRIIKELLEKEKGTKSYIFELKMQHQQEG